MDDNHLRRWGSWWQGELSHGEYTFGQAQFEADAEEDCEASYFKFNLRQLRDRLDDREDGA